MDPKQTAKLRKVVGRPEAKRAHRLLRALGGIGRFRILLLLKAHGEPLKVTDIATVLRVSCSSASHDLRKLRQCGLVSHSSKGRERHYKTNGALDELRFIP